MSLVIPFMLLVSMYLLRFRNARPMAALAIGLILAYAVASFLFMMDNLRFLLPAYLFAITVSLGAIREFWRHDRT
jgi:riboflavin transporter FmnP